MSELANNINQSSETRNEEAHPNLVKLFQLLLKIDQQQKQKEIISSKKSNHDVLIYENNRDKNRNS